MCWYDYPLTYSSSRMDPLTSRAEAIAPIPSAHISLLLKLDNEKKEEHVQGQSAFSITFDMW